MMPMMQPMYQQPGYPQQQMQGGMPQGYAQQPYYGQPQQGYAQQQMLQNQPANATGRSYASGDRLPAIPDMLKRPTSAAVIESRQPVVRGAAPEQALTRAPAPPAPSSQSWKPIRIPSPDEMGIASVTETKPTPVSTVALPDRYDLGTVTAWLDRQGARSCHRERLAEGIQFECSFTGNMTPIKVRGNTDEEALQKLVQEVVRVKQELSANQR
ncbi:MAG TPA: hypothetical protein PLN21_21210 [Gemmatales bacterium]|nr:hypothetical protein [Gemmatales bacterium]